MSYPRSGERLRKLGEPMPDTSEWQRHNQTAWEILMDDSRWPQESYVVTQNSRDLSEAWNDREVMAEVALYRRTVALRQAE